MSRYERRLGSKSSSPRPGQAVCKLPKNNNNVLSGFINIKEKEISSNNQNVMIEELQEETQDSSIKKVMNINDQLRKAMGKITDKNIRLIYGHEIRLNTMELNVDCLNDIKCSSILNVQEDDEKQEIIINNTEKITELYAKYNNLLSSIKNISKLEGDHAEEINKNIEQEKIRISNLDTNYNNLEQKIREISENIESKLMKSIEGINQRIEKNSIEKINEKEMQKNEKQNLENEKQNLENEKQNLDKQINDITNKNKKLINIIKKMVNRMDDSKDILKEINKLNKN